MLNTKKQGRQNEKNELSLEAVADMLPAPVDSNDKPVPHTEVENNQADEPRVEVIIRRQWNDWRCGSVNLDDLENVHWDTLSGGVCAPCPQPFMHAYVWCDQIEGEVAHSCRHGRGPHRIKVCIVKADNAKDVIRDLLAMAGPKPPRVSKRNPNTA